MCVQMPGPKIRMGGVSICQLVELSEDRVPHLQMFTKRGTSPLSNTIVMDLGARATSAEFSHLPDMAHFRNCHDCALL